MDNNDQRAIEILLNGTCKIPVPTKDAPLVAIVIIAGGKISLVLEGVRDHQYVPQEVPGPKPKVFHHVFNYTATFDELVSAFQLVKAIHNTKPPEETKKST